MDADQWLVRSSLDALDDVFYVFDGDQRLVYWNDELNEVFGLTDEELSGMQPESFFVEADRPRIRAAVEEALTTGETVVEARANTADEVTQFELTGRRLVDENGAVIGFCGIGRDVTDRREREARLGVQNDRLESFADVVSHDIKNPLAVAHGYLELAHAETTSESVHAHLDRVEAALERVTTIVDDVLEDARDDRSDREHCLIPLEPTARAAWEMVDTGDATLDVRTKRRVTANEPRLRRLFENLFKNSVEHGSTSNRPQADDSVEHGSTGNRPQADESDDDHLSVLVEDTPDGFAVEDDGVGISEHRRADIFAPGVSGSSDGTGLGLHVVRRIAAAHGWSVTALAGRTGGARFEFSTAHQTDDADHPVP